MLYPTKITGEWAIRYPCYCTGGYTKPVGIVFSISVTDVWLIADDKCSQLKLAGHTTTIIQL